MNEEIVKKLIEMIKGDILKTVIGKENSEDTLTFDYDNKENKYSVELKRVLEDGKEDIKQKSSLSMEEVIPFIKNPEFTSEVIAVYQRRIEEESKYSQAKQELMRELNSIDISNETRETMLSIIEQVSQLPECVGNGNRVIITDEPAFKEEVRLADETNWSNQGSTLHLQLVQCVVEESGTKHHNYPQKNLEQLVQYISDKNITLKNNDDVSLDIE